MPVAPEYLHMVYPGPFPAFLYGRASRDPKKKGRSVRDQITTGRRICDAHGWPIAAVFDGDVDRSASRHARKKRDDFEEMLKGIAAGECRIVVAFEASRYYRDLEAYLRLRNACAESGVLLCYNGQVYDLSKREDRKATAQDALQAEDEGEGIRERNLRTARENAQAGTPHGRILFGYARRYDPETGDLVEQYEHPEHGPMVREVFERIAAGETGYSILKDFAERGLMHGDVPWRDYHLTNMLRNPGYIGRRIFQGKDIGAAQWPALVDDETFYVVQRIVKNPARNTTRDRSVKHMLSFLACCGACGEAPPLKVLKARGYLTYVCSGTYDTVMRKELLDAYVEEAVIRWLRSDAALDAFRSEAKDAKVAAARIRVEQLTAQLQEARGAAGRFRPDGTPELSVASLGALEAALTPQIEQAAAETEAAAVPPLLRGLVGSPDVEASWGRLVLPQQRMVLKRIVNVRLHKARARGVRRIEPGRVRLTFVGQPGFRYG